MEAPAPARNQDSVWRRRLIKRWPHLLGALAWGIYACLLLASNGKFVGSYAPFIALWGFTLLHPLFKADAQGEAEEARGGADWVCITFPGRWRPSNFLANIFAAIQAGCLVFVAYQLNPKTPFWAMAGIAASALLIAFCSVIAFHRIGPRKRFVLRAEYNLAREIVDPQLSVAKNVRRMQSYTWGERQKARDIVCAALGLAPVHPEIASPYPR